MSKIMSQVTTASQSNSCRSSTGKTLINGKSSIGKIAPSASASSSNKTTGNQKAPVSPEPSSLDLTIGKRTPKVTRIPISGSMAHLADGSDPDLEVTREHIGKLVCISGTQIGILRYLGTTKFQEGVWAGIELENSVGKNDGSVNGQRYFHCKEKYGIFAPISKVSPVTEILSAQKYAASALCLTGKSEPSAIQSVKDKLVLELQSLETDTVPPSPTTSPIPAPATTPVQSNGSEYELFKNGKRLKKEGGKCTSKPNDQQQQQKKRKLDPEQKSWSATAAMKCPAALLESLVPHLARFKEEIKSSGSISSPLHSPPKNYHEAFSDKVPSSTPTRKVRQNLMEPLNGSEEESTIIAENSNSTLLAEEKKVAPKPEEEEFPFAVPFVPKRPNSIGLPPGVSSEESSELGIFGVSTPELIGGDGTSLALSFPTSCCSSPEALDNESSLGLLTPSQLQDCWNSNANEEDLYQHLRSPSVDDLEEFEEEKTVDQDLSSATYSYGSHGGAYMSTTVACQPCNKVPEEESACMSQTLEEIKESESIERVHPPLSLRGSGSGYCGSDPLTDSDFNTESEADEKGCMPQNRNARVIDGNLYTSHSIMSKGEREARKPIDVVSASEMESSGFYSDASERNPSGGSTESTTSGENRRHHRNNYSKVNQIHSHRHYSSSSQHSDPEPNETLGHYRTPIPLDADRNLDLLIISSLSHENLGVIPDIQDDKVDSLEKFIADELDHEKSYERTITCDSCQSSSSSSSQVLKPPNDSQVIQTNAADSVAASSEQLENAVVSETTLIGQDEREEDTDTPSEKFANGNDVVNVHSTGGSPVASPRKEIQNAEPNAGVPLTLEIRKKGVGSEDSPLIAPSSMTTMNTPSSPTVPSILVSGLAPASVRSQSASCIRSLASGGNAPAPATTTQNKASNNRNGSAPTRRNLTSKETAAGKTVSVTSRLGSNNKATEPAGSARTENRRIMRPVAVSKTDTGMSKGKPSSSTKENVSGLLSSNRSIVGSNKSLAGLGGDQKNILNAAVKKLNKWDAVMSKINETKNKQINVKDIKSKVYNSVTRIGSNISTAHHGKENKMGKATGDNNNEHNPVPPLHLHNHFSSRSSTASDSSADDHRGPPPKHRLKKETPISRRQISDLSSASDYSVSKKVSHQNSTQRRAVKPSGGNGKVTEKPSSTNQSNDTKNKPFNGAVVGKPLGISGSASNTTAGSANMTRAQSSVKPLRDKNRILLPDKKKPYSNQGQPKNEDGNHLPAYPISHPFDDSHELAHLKLSLLEEKETLKQTEVKIVALSTCIQFFQNKYFLAEEGRRQAEKFSETVKTQLGTKEDELSQLSKEHQKEKNEWEKRLAIVIKEHKEEFENILKTTKEELENGKVLCEERIKEIRTEVSRELDKLKECHKTEIDTIIAGHEEKLDEYRKKPGNEVFHDEITSLHYVIDIRNNEIKKLREDLIHHRSVQEDLVVTKEQNKALLAKIEDVEAQLEKARGDKRELQENYQLIQNNLSQLEVENSRLSQCNEELCWRIQTLRTDERVSHIMTKSATELGLTASHEFDRESAVHSLLDSSRIRTSGGGLAYEAILNGPEWSSTSAASHVFAAMHRKKSSAVSFLADRHIGAKKFNKSLDEVELRKSLNGGCDNSDSVQASSNSTATLSCSMENAATLTSRDECRSNRDVVSTDSK